MPPVNHYTHLLCLVLLAAYLTVALPPGFDSMMLRYLVPGYHQLRLGDECLSSSQCGNYTCCLNRGPPQTYLPTRCKTWTALQQAHRSRICTLGSVLAFLEDVAIREGAVVCHCEVVAYADACKVAVEK
ncbi:hypothetical protein MTO96_035053 [Rhipicephalus appendiculatus]